MNRIQRIILVTNGFPYGKVEKSFIMPELRELKKKYKVIIISNPTESFMEDKENYTMLDDEIEIYAIKCNMSFKEKIKFGICGILKIDFFYEVLDILKSQEKIIDRIHGAIIFSGHAEYFYYKMKKLHSLKSKKGDLFYTFWNNAYPLALVRHKKELGNPLIISRIHGADLYNEVTKGGYQPFKNLMGHRLDAIIFASSYGLKYFENNWGYSNKLQYFPLGVEYKGKTAQYDFDTFTIVSCSNIIETKRIDLIIEGLSGIDIGKSYYKKIRWVHMGDGPKRSNVEKMAKGRLSKIKNLSYEFKGFCTNDEVRNFYLQNSVNCFITTSQTEGGNPVSIQEAMSAGIPIIGTKVGGITEMIDEGINGYLLSAMSSPGQVTEAIQKMVEMPLEELKKMGENSYILWNKWFNSYKTNKKFLEFIEHNLGCSGEVRDDFDCHNLENYQ